MAQWQPTHPKGPLGAARLGFHVFFPTSWASSDCSNFKTPKTPKTPKTRQLFEIRGSNFLRHPTCPKKMFNPQTTQKSLHATSKTTSSPMAPPGMPWSARSRVDCRMAFDIFPRCLGLGGWDDIPMESSHPQSMNIGKDFWAGSKTSFLEILDLGSKSHSDLSPDLSQA